jgi:hypothetical protein
LCGLCKTGKLGALACRGGHRSRRYRRLCPRRGRLRQFAILPGDYFNEAVQLQGCAMPGAKRKILMPNQSVLSVRAVPDSSPVWV